MTRRDVPGRAWLRRGLLVLGTVLATPETGQADVAERLKALDLAAYPRDERPPEFSGRTVDGQRLSLERLRGRVVLLTFWTTWCVPCRDEMAVLDRLHRDLGPKGLAVVGVGAGEKPAAVSKYSAALGVSYPLIVDPRGEIQAAYGVVGVPTSFLIGRDGRAVARAVGPRDWDGAQSRALIRALLAEPIRSR